MNEDKADRPPWTTELPDVLDKLREEIRPLHTNGNYN